MFSRFLLGLLAVLTVVLFGCDLPLNEKPPATDPLLVDLGTSTDCLSHVAPVLELYFDGAANDPQLGATWDCMITALSTFEKSVRGRYEDRFTARELAHFLEEYFIEGETRIPDPLLLQVFRIKQLFVGGEMNSITRTEMKNMENVLASLRDLSLRLNPYMKVYTFNWKFEPDRSREVQDQFFDQSNMEIQAAAYELAALISKNGMPYRLENVVFLLKELAAFNEEEWPWLAEVERAMPLVYKLKKSLAGGDEIEISPGEWQRFALLSGRGFIQYLRYYYFIKMNTTEGNSSQLIYFTRSVDDLFDYMGNMVAGKPGAKLTREELLEILQALTAFVPDLKISDELLIEAMKIKVVFFGGRVDWFVKEDFDKARDKLEAFRSITENFLKYSDVYGLSWKGTQLSAEERRTHFKKAENSLEEVAESLGRNMENPYDLMDLIRLAEEIDQLYPAGGADQSLSEMAKKFIPVVITMKNLVFSDESSMIGGVTDRVNGQRMSPSEQWTLFLQVTAKFYSRYSFFHYFLADKSLTVNPGLTDFETMVVDSSRFLDFLISKKPKGVITFEEIGTILVQAENSGVWPEKIQMASVEKLIKVLFQKILISPAKRIDGYKPAGLTYEATEQLRNEFGLWADTQKFLSQSFQGVSEAEGKPASDILAELNSAPDVTSIRDLKLIFGGPLTLSFDEVGRLYMSKPALNYRYSTVTTINLVRAATRFMIRSYAMDLDRVNSYYGVSLEEVNSLYDDVKPIVIDLGLLSPKDTKFAENRFRDANLFTPVGNGDSYVNFREGTNLFMMILSGMKIDELMFTEMEKVCPVQKNGELKEDWNADIVCVTQFYQKYMPYAFVSVPDYLKFQTALTEEAYRAVFLNLVKAAGYVPQASGHIRIADLALFPHAVQYLEGMYQVYDTDRSGTLNTKEALKAFPTYRQILKDVSGFNDDKILKALFTWMLEKGKPPTSPAEKAIFMATWVPKGEDGWKINSDRAKVASILGFIADALSKQKTAPAAVAPTPTPEPPATEIPNPDPTASSAPMPAPDLTLNPVFFSEVSGY